MGTANDAPREVDDLAVLDSWGAPAILQANHTHHGATTVWEEGSSSYAGDPDWELRIARHIELLDTGQLVPRWSVLVGSEKYAGSAKYIKEGTRYEAPVGSIQQAAMLDQLIEDVSASLAEALRIWVWPSSVGSEAADRAGTLLTPAPDVLAERQTEGLHFG